MPYNLGRRNDINFDQQAEIFDQRAGLPPQACREIASKLVELTALEANDLLLDVGAGTGEIGSEILRLHARYVGLDLSLPMLRVFQLRGDGSGGPVSLIVGDANLTWPIADHCVRVIFGSRSLHLLNTAMLVQEAFRVGKSPGAILVVGRVRRDSQSVKARMRQKMRCLLNNVESQPPVIDALVERGAVAFAPLVATRWTTATSPADSLRSWRSKPGLGGTDVPEPQKSEILSKLERWAVDEFQSLDRRLQSTEEYVLEGARLFVP